MNQNVTVTYTLSQAGQRVALLAGKTATATVTEIMVLDDPAMLDAVQIGTDGSLSLNASKQYISDIGRFYSAPLFDAPPETLADVIAAVKAVREKAATQEAEEMAIVTARNAEQAQRAADKAAHDAPIVDGILVEYGAIEPASIPTVLSGGTYPTLYKDGVRLTLTDAQALAKEMPNRPATVADALPLVPGVVREPGGGLRISDSPENRSALIVNSADVTDPGTGQFGLTVPMDSVQTINVYQTAFLAEYGRFTAGLVSVETKRGGDKWKWELNDPFPEFRIRSWHLRGLKTATPRLNFEGPIVPGKLYLAEGFEFEVRKTEVYELPFPRNQKLQQGLNSFTQLDCVATRDR